MSKRRLCKTKERRLEDVKKLHNKWIGKSILNFNGFHAQKLFIQFQENLCGMFLRNDV